MAGDKELDSSLKDGGHCDFGSESVTDRADSKHLANATGSKIDEALHQSVKELEMLEKFYQQRGKTERAIEISLTLRRMRDGSKKSNNTTDSRQDGH
ncbi:MAG: hypothetical protein P4L53_07490 [Candidatus Obscuribacterales bacterium]|nr:hypothetical protein [Candidatus Obscuribacterales bacterium]